MGENIPLTPGVVIGGGSTWEPEHETLFRGKTQRTRPKEALVEGLYLKEQVKPQTYSILMISK